MTEEGELTFTTLEESNDMSQLIGVYQGQSEGSLSSMSFVPQLMTPFQKNACILSHVLALLAVGLVAIWVNQDAMGGGGLSWNTSDKRIFNWHPVMMILAFAFMTLASLTFRVEYYSSNRKMLKFLHGIKWTMAAICATIGLTAVFKSHNYATPPVANLYSLHSWIGLFTIALYLYQFSSGTITFGLSLVSSPQYRASILSFHRFLGPCIYIVTGTTILLGIQEKEGFVGCSYPVTTPDYNPIIHYSDIPMACRISHGLGLVVLLMMLSTSYALCQLLQPLEAERTLRTD